jgi:hypothetical protein
MMSSKACPNCGLFSIGSALVCDCGYRFPTPEMAAAPGTAGDGVEEPIPRFPWLTIWYKPRGTIRAIVDNDPDYYVKLIAATGGVLTALSQMIDRGYGDSIHWTGLLTMALIGGPIGGILSVYIAGAYFGFITEHLNGRAENREIRTVLAWSSMPLIVFSALSVPFWAAAFGPELFKSQMPAFEARVMDSPFLALFFLVMTGVMMFFGLTFRLWSLTIFLKGLSEVNGFSVWRALAAAVIALVPLLIIAACALAAVI